MENTIAHGDAVELLRSVPDGSVDLLLTDPPYHIVPGGCTNARGGIFNNRDGANKALTSGRLFAHNEVSFADWLPEVYRVLKDRTHAYIMINGRNLKDLQTAAEQAGFRFVNLLVWRKNTCTMNRYYMNRAEFILMLRKGRARTINEPGTANILDFPNPTGHKLHPTQKPVELMQVFIRNSTDVGGVVLDPFMGSGSTVVACIATGRRFIGYELDDTYFQTAQERINRALLGG